MIKFYKNEKKKKKELKHCQTLLHFHFSKKFPVFYHDVRQPLTEAMLV